MAPQEIQETAHILILLGIIAVAIVSERFYSYLTIAVTLVVSSLLKEGGVNNLQDFIEWNSPFIVGIVAIEAIIRIKDSTRSEIDHLEIINNISRQIMLSILNATMQEAHEADTYFGGTVKENEIHLPLFYDGRQYFHNVKIPNEIFRLMDLADQRLYIAKARGRNQVESSLIPDAVL